MRDVKRLDKFYNDLKKIHKKSFPDWRFGQFIINFLSECGDTFYWEEDKFITNLKNFANRNSNLHKWEE